MVWRVHGSDYCRTARKRKRRPVADSTNRQDVFVVQHLWSVEVDAFIGAFGQARGQTGACCKGTCRSKTSACAGIRQEAFFRPRTNLPNTHLALVRRRDLEAVDGLQQPRLLVQELPQRQLPPLPDLRLLDARRLRLPPLIELVVEDLM